MDKETLIAHLEARAEALLNGEAGHFLVEVRIKPTNNVKVFVDGDEGISIGDLASYNRRLYRELEESAVFPDGNFSLEVSSPGLDEPLKKERQYRKNIGRFAEVTLTDGITTREGKITAVTETGIDLEIEEGKGKKKIVRTENLAYENIKTTKILVKF